MSEAATRWRVGLIDSCGEWPHAVEAAAFVSDGLNVNTREPAGDATGHGSRIAHLLTRHRSIDLILGQVFVGTAPATAAAVGAAIDWAVAVRANLIHLSLGLADDRPVLATALARALAAGCIVVAAAPARGGPAYPAAYPGVIRGTGDARCASGELSCLRPGLFGASPRLEPDTGAVNGGSSIGAAWVTHAILDLSPGLAPASITEALSRRATYLGPEHKSPF